MSGENEPEVVQQPMWTNPFENVPKLSKSIAILLPLSFLCGVMFPPFLPFFGLIPANTSLVHFYFWNVFTCNFVEQSLFSAIFSAIAMLFCGKFEPIWGSKEQLRFISIVAVWNGVLSFFFLVLMYLMFGWEEALFGLFCGFDAVIVGFLVAFKQVMPPQKMQLFFSFELESRYLPMVMLGLVLLIGLLFGQFHSVPFVLFGWIVSWTYLRFFQPHINGEIGDLDPSFCFADFFPAGMREFVDHVASGILRMFNACGLFVRDFPEGDWIGGDLERSSMPKGRGRVIGTANGGAPLEGKEKAASSIPRESAGASHRDSEAERRRQLALKAVNERMRLAKEAEAKASQVGEEKNAFEEVQEMEKSAEQGDDVGGGH
eukprot:TRINITY_DN82797_c0_g1_i1.p1 TRINITY_DN82797_c0_g1~~TRINITY_DN82797_c0_g1_i1.p1  ORF type:complete len:374 (-),score=93.96 TRINITY_DN82797_c0_g1_i1:59-1180(-)